MTTMNYITRDIEPTFFEIEKSIYLLIFKINGKIVFKKEYTFELDAFKDFIEKIQVAWKEVIIRGCDDTIYSINLFRNNELWLTFYNCGDYDGGDLCFYSAFNIKEYNEYFLFSSSENSYSVQDEKTSEIYSYHDMMSLIEAHIER